ncbi:MAG: S26 family signal peptidase, partial [Gemmataceae bacterium]
APKPLRVGPESGEMSQLEHPGLALGQIVHVEFAFVDRRILLAIDGVEAVGPIDLPAIAAQLQRRDALSRPLQLGVRDAKVRLTNLRLARDVYYRSDRGHATSAPYKLASNEFFMLGDNSSNSHDSRSWEIPGVPERDFIGKPILIHQPLTLRRMNWDGNPRLYQSLDWDRLRWLR